MYKDLPEDLKVKVLGHLEADQFTQAKRIVDQYKAEQYQPDTMQLAGNY